MRQLLIQLCLLPYIAFPACLIETDPQGGSGSVSIVAQAFYGGKRELIDIPGVATGAEGESRGGQSGV